jgi:alkanesulfonate monooxygenase SsuD/methylene tetrahydromethanopterin reductase-like flavin-dependent oxidoreductase (luciferase family)
VPAFSSRSSRFGVVLPQGWRGDLGHLDARDPAAQFEAMVAVGREADRLGFDSVWLYDHLQPSPTFECWTSLAAVARETRQVRLGQLVTCNLYRNPALLARMAATLDAASGGRCVVGLGAGWDEEEYRDHHYPAPWPEVGERLRLLDEGAAIARPLLGRIPLMIGGQGERVLLRLVAKHADACNLTDSVDPAFYRHKLEVLRTHCDELGRDETAIVKTASFTVHLAEREADLSARATATRGGSAVGTPAELVELFGTLREAGIDYFILYFDNPASLDALRLFAAEVVPRMDA